MIRIHTFGDSHSSHEHSQWGKIKLPNVNINCNHIGPKLMYSFGRMGLELLDIRNYGVEENDIIIFCFGEIDCRNHVHKHVNKDKTYKVVINDIVNIYFNSIKENISLFENLKVCIYNVVPPLRYIDVGADHPFPFLGSDEERKLYYNYMNFKIEELCKQNNFIFFDIYKESCDEQGFIKNEYCDGVCHLIHPEHTINFIKNNLLKKYHK